MALIVDAAIDALRSVIQARINGTTGFAANFRETLKIDDGDCLPINATYPCDPFTVDGVPDAVQSGNIALPIFGLWRTDDTWEQETYEWDGDGGVARYKYILPATANADVAWPVLRAVVRQMRIYLQAIDPAYPVAATSRYHPERKADIATLRAAGISTTRAELAPKITASYAYAGPEKSSLYPTVTGTFSFKCREVWTPDLYNFDQFVGNLHLVGRNQDLDAAEVRNPLVRVKAPNEP